MSESVLDSGDCSVGKGSKNISMGIQVQILSTHMKNKPDMAVTDTCNPSNAVCVGGGGVEMETQGGG